VQYHGGLNDQKSANDSGEANLDNQYILSVAYPIPVTEFSTGGRGFLIPDGIRRPQRPTQTNHTSTSSSRSQISITTTSRTPSPSPMAKTSKKSPSPTQIKSAISSRSWVLVGSRFCSRAAIQDQKITASQMTGTTERNSSLIFLLPVPGNCCRRHSLHQARTGRLFLLWRLL
jgi:hypothetical protein